MNKIRIYFVIFLTLILPMSVFSQQKMKLAVLDPVVAGEKLTDGLVISVREIVSSSFVNYADNYSIVERSLIDKVMQEAKFSNSDAVDESQATQLGKLAGADKVVLTVISRFDNRCMMSIKLIDVESATIDRQISKLVDMSSVLDVTEPLTLAVLGKGDANLIQTSNMGQRQTQAGTASTGSDNANSSGGKLKNLFRKKNNSSGSASIPAQVNNNQFVAVPEFSGTGINYQPLGTDIPPQNEEFDLNKFGLIYNTTNFNIIVDFSDTRVEGIPLMKFREMKQPSNDKVFGYDFFNRMNSEIARLVKALNNETDLTFTYWAEAPITLIVKVRDIDDPGRENLSDYVFFDNTTGELLTGVRLKSKGGRFGSWTNLLGDAFEEDAAPSFSKKLKAAKKKYKKLIGK